MRIAHLPRPCSTSSVTRSAGTLQSLALTAAILIASTFPCAGAEGISELTAKQRFDSVVGPFLKSHCTECHGATKAKGKLTLHDIGSDPADTKSIAAWERVLEQLEIGRMPPEDADQPKAAERERVIQWIRDTLILAGKGYELKSKMLLPEFGNRVSHELLFDGSIKDMSASPSRLWRISPYIYAGKGLQPGPGVKTEPVAYSTKTNGIRDYSSQEIVGESGFSMLMMAFDDILSKQMHDSKNVQRSKADPKKFEVKETVEVIRGNPSFMAISEAPGAPAQEAMERVVRDEFLRAMGRPIDAEEQSRYLKFMENCIQKAGNESGLKVAIMAIYLSPEAIYRMELGLGKEDEFGRRRLSSHELAYALSYALTDAPPGNNAVIKEALASNQLSTKADVERVVRRMVADGAPPINIGLPGPFDQLRAQGKRGYAYLPRVLRFFEEFFEYPKAAGVFKDGKHGTFGPRAVPGVAQGHVAAIVNADTHVFEELLTSPRFNCNRDRLLDQLKTDFEERLKKMPVAKKEEAAKQYEKTRGQGAKLPNETFRAGILTDPAWLIAHSKCTENDPVHRGKWIRERLLAGCVPDLPIGVEAKIPEDHDRTLRDRFKVVEKQECWKCHVVMNPLGMPFECFNDVGRIRTGLYLDKKKREFLETIDEAEAEKLAAAGKIDILPVNARGVLTGTGEPALDGEVKDAIDLVQRLAKSARVRQSIIRHAFRYWMGRNETLSDSKTLIAADKAYVESGGKFSEVIVSLLTSDSFLYRKQQ